MSLEFYKKTRPPYKMVICRIETWDCRRNWRLVKTAKGYCIEFAIDTRRIGKTYWIFSKNLIWRIWVFKKSSAPDQNIELRQLGFTIAYNKTDATYGWNGFMNGLTVYYLNINTTLQEETHSFPLIPRYFNKWAMARI